MYKIGLLLILGALFFTKGTEALAASFILSSDKTSLRQDDQFIVAVKLNAASEKVYAIQPTFSFTPDILSVVSWKFSDNWMSLTQRDFDFLDNRKGILIKSAGYPGGIKGSQDYGQLTVQAKRAGRGTIRITKAAVYNARNRNVYTSTNDLVVEVSRGLPRQLFDIRLELDKSAISSMREFEARVIMESFGTEPTPISLTFKIVDSAGTVIATKQETITVETRNVYAATFPELTLAEGNYTVYLNTNYNNGVNDEFSQAFTIYKTNSPVADIFIVVVVVLGIVSLGITFMYIRKTSPTRGK